MKMALKHSISIVNLLISKLIILIKEPFQITQYDK